MDRVEMRKQAVELMHAETRREERSIMLTEHILHALKGYEGKVGKRLEKRVQATLDEFHPSRFEAWYHEPYNFKCELTIIDLEAWQKWRKENNSNVGQYHEPDKACGVWLTNFNLPKGIAEKNKPDWDEDAFLESNACHYRAAKIRNARRAQDEHDGTLDKWLTAAIAVKDAEDALERLDEPEHVWTLRRELGL